MTHRFDHHPPCRCGCGELADECAGPRPNPLGSLRISTADPNPYHSRRDDTAPRISQEDNDTAGGTA